MNLLILASCARELLGLPSSAYMAHEPLQQQQQGRPRGSKSARWRSVEGPSAHWTWTWPAGIDPVDMRSWIKRPSLCGTCCAGPEGKNTQRSTARFLRRLCNTQRARAGSTAQRASQTKNQACV
ncbi:hypothetical protein BKA62DRAFT_720436 [Auriculariales sp. MPI-PUGE-AT-0066]|nr:hypothetical protein BKA62DRAFT_720436 [Auriculariales sp. MPI-PUGE-AT-0066]